MGSDEGAVRAWLELTAADAPPVDGARLREVRRMAARAYQGAGAGGGWRWRRAVAAIAAAVLVVVGVTWMQGGRSYAWAEVPATLARAQTLHYRVTTVSPKGTREVTERWQDFVHARARSETGEERVVDGATVVRRSWSVSVGTSQLIVDEIQKKASLREVRRTPAAEALHRSWDRLALSWSIAVEGVGKAVNFRKTGSEVVAGQQTDVWEGETPVVWQDSQRREVKVWVAAGGAGGQARIVRAETREITSEGEANSRTVEVLGQDEPLDEKLFSLERPAGYGELLPVGNEGAVEHVNIYMGSTGSLMPMFVLDNGALVVGWRDDKILSKEWADGGVPAALAGQRFGERLAAVKWGAEVRAVIGKGYADIGFDGYMLGVEPGPWDAKWVWCVFVPREPLAEDGLYQYRVRVGGNDAAARMVTPVHGAAEFAALVRGTMEDYRKAGEAGVDAGMTYEAVMGLGQEGNDGR
jgi:hypothetical protein